MYSMDDLQHQEEMDTSAPTATTLQTPPLSPYTPPTTTTPPPTPINATNATFRNTDVRLRVPQPQQPLFSTVTTTQSILPLTQTFAALSTSSPPATPHLSTTTDPQPSTSSTLGARPRLRSTAPAPRTSTYTVRGSPRRPPPPSRRPTRDCPPPTPPSTPQQPHRRVSASHLFWWCEENSCGRANARDRQACSYCGKRRVVACRKRSRGD